MSCAHILFVIQGFYACKRKSESAYFFRIYILGGTKLKDIFKLMRVNHYVKNVLVFIPLVFSKRLFEQQTLVYTSVGFLVFCLISSCIYIFNDIQDAERDRRHPVKCNRPIAKGTISVKKATILISIIFLCSCVVALWKLPVLSCAFLVMYIILNVLYSLWLKKVPLLDIFILASGFVIRVIYGGIISGVVISEWLYLVIISGSIFMGLGKRRNELKKNEGSREVLKYYTKEFLDKNMYVCMALIEAFYAIWALNSSPKMIVTIPIIIAILMKYSLDIEGESDGDPVNVLLSDIVLLGLLVIYAIIIMFILYFT